MFDYFLQNNNGCHLFLSMFKSLLTENISNSQLESTKMVNLTMNSQSSTNKADGKAAKKLGGKNTLGFIVQASYSCYNILINHAYIIISKL